MFNCSQFQHSLACLSGQNPQLSLHVFERIASTNQKLWELIEEGINLPAAAIAMTQTAGRGQWGKAWQSEPGGLYLSIALTTQIAASKAAHLTLCTAWGIANALKNCRVPVLLKWPNDLVLEGRKLGGIKSEVCLQQHNITCAVIGVGINWTNSVPEVGINLKSFYQKKSLLPSITSLEELAAIAAYGVLSGYHRYQLAGIETVLPSYLELLHSQGREVVVNGCPGIVVGVNSKGELCVRLRSAGAAAEVCLQPGAISLGYPP